jgi:hypothetical protein
VGLEIRAAPRAVGRHRVPWVQGMQPVG